MCQVQYPTLKQDLTKLNLARAEDEAVQRLWSASLLRLDVLAPCRALGFGEYSNCRMLFVVSCWNTKALCHDSVAGVLQSLIKQLLLRQAQYHACFWKAFFKDKGRMGIELCLELTQNLCG